MTKRHKIAMVDNRSIEERFNAFHAQNPLVFEALKRLALDWKAKGHKTGSITMLYEVLRWEVGLTTRSLDFRLDNSFRAAYARLLMAQVPELEGFFDTRASQADEYIQPSPAITARARAMANHPSAFRG